MEATVRRVLPCGEATILFHVYDEAATRVCEVRKLDGHIDLKPKAWLSLVRSEIKIIEKVARDVGCDEVRMSGRFNAKMLPDYEPYTALDGSPCLKKRLFDG
jgi:hypothetical protein